MPSSRPLFTLALTGLCLGAPLGLAPAVHAQAPAPATAVPTTPLPIVLPPGARLQAEFDGRDADLLGQLKGFLKSMSVNGSDPPSAAAAGPSNDAGKGTGGVVSQAPDWLGLLGDGQLSALFHDIHHLHLVAFTLAAPPAGRAGAPDLTEFYEKPFTQTGGRRLFWRAGEPQILLEGFDSPHGFAAVVSSSGTSYVLRADGYPDLQVLGTIFHLNTPGAPAPAPSIATAPTPAK